MTCRENVIDFNHALQRKKAPGSPCTLDPNDASPKIAPLSESEIASSQLIYAFISKHIISKFNAILQIGTDQNVSDSMLWLRIKSSDSTQLRSIVKELLCVGVLCGMNEQLDYVDIPSIYVLPEWIESSNNIEFVRFNNTKFSTEDDEAVESAIHIDNDTSDMNNAVSLCQYRSSRCF